MKKSRRHALGQHFLRDPNILNKIAAAVRAAPGEAVLEIGAGKGPLTLALARAGARVIAVEKDPPLAAELIASKIAGVTIVESDVLDLDWPALMKEHGAPDGPFAVAGNLPYSISSPILFRVLDLKGAISRAVFLLQREVAERITSGPGSKDYAPLGILLQIHFEAKILFRLHPGSFTPPPKVESAVLVLTKRDRPLVAVEDEAGFRKFLFAAFAQRRKTLSNNLSAAGYPSEEIARVLAALSLPKTVRAEQIDIGQWADLQAAFHGASIR
ncbi:MAG: 16S rRNA (adenine(1518)-N(6)/adenine(1519)-N(6))-dimethyltransferase RsmA [Candidatus Aminicenantales bacterium]